VRDFFRWLVSEQEEEDWGLYEHAGEVAVEEMWTVRDLREMSDVKSDLYKVAVMHFKLKDGVVRHLCEDLRRFKVEYRTANSLLEMGSTAEVRGGLVE
jgi:3-dehydroquinate dehydratase